MNPIVSVIIPVYKVEKYLHRCVDSLLTQTFTEFEVLLIDDGSPDNSGAICDEYAKKDSRVRVFHKINGGVSSARNLGIKNAKGQYITFVDSDDWVTPSYIEDFEVEKIADVRCLVMQGIKQFYPNKNKEQIFFSYDTEVLSLHDNPEALYEKRILLNGCPVAKLFIKKVIDENEILFNEAISLNEDHLFHLDYLYHIDSVITKQSINYIYLYDFKEISLTKSKHPSNESIDVAQALFTSIDKLVDKYSISIPNTMKGIFGPYQLIRASISCYNEYDGYAKFCKVIEAYKKMVNHTESIKGYNFYSNSYIYLVYRIKPYFLYVYLLICSIISNIYNKLKYLVKLLISRNLCSIL